MDLALGELIETDNLNSYLGKIFEFKNLSEEENKLPMFYDNGDSLQTTFNIKKPNKVITKDKTPLQILHEYSQKVLKVPVCLKKIERHSQHDFFYGNCNK